MTDHRTEAIELLGVAGETDDTAMIRELAALAQVHATLALVDATLAQTAAMERLARSSTPVLGQRL